MILSMANKAVNQSRFVVPLTGLPSLPDDVESTVNNNQADLDDEFGLYEDNDDLVSDTKSDWNRENKGLIIIDIQKFTISEQKNLRGLIMRCYQKKRQRQARWRV